MKGKEENALLVVAIKLKVRSCTFNESKTLQDFIEHSLSRKLVSFNKFCPPAPCCAYNALIKWCCSVYFQTLTSVRRQGCAWMVTVSTRRGHSAASVWLGWPWAWMDGCVSVSKSDPALVTLWWIATQNKFIHGPHSMKAGGGNRFSRNCRRQHQHPSLSIHAVLSDLTWYIIMEAHCCARQASVSGYNTKLSRYFMIIFV